MEAENKNKGYRALIWSQRAVTAAELQRTLCDTHLLFKDVDEDGAPCLAVSGLRVCLTEAQESLSYSGVI